MSVKSQSKTKDYKYIIVPLQYDFLKGKDSYRLNTQTRFLLKQEGFDVYFDEGEELPEDLFNNRCLAMYADVHKVKGTFLKTKLKISFKDCFGKTILESEEGATNKKDLDIAYKEALKRAFVTLNFSKLQNTLTTEPEVMEEVKQVVEVKKETKEITTEKDVVAEKIEEKEVSTPDTKEVNTVEEKEVKKESVTSNTKTDIVYYAEKISGGFQLLDSEPKIVMVLLETASPDIFLVKDQNAMVIKREGKWVYSENKEGQLKEKPLNIKF